MTGRFVPTFMALSGGIQTLEAKYGHYHFSFLSNAGCKKEILTRTLKEWEEDYEKLINTRTRW